MARKAPRAGDIISLRPDHPKKRVRVIRKVIRYDDDGYYTIFLTVRDVKADG